MRKKERQMVRGFGTVPGKTLQRQSKETKRERFKKKNWNSGGARGEPAASMW